MDKDLRQRAVDRLIGIDYPILECAIKLLSKPGKWTKGSLAKKRVTKELWDAQKRVFVKKRVLDDYDPKTNEEVSVFDSGVQNYCLIGALKFCAGPENADDIPVTGDIYQFNDDIDTKKKDILDVIKEAMEIKAGGFPNDN